MTCKPTRRDKLSAMLVLYCRGGVQGGETEARSRLWVPCEDAGTLFGRGRGKAF